MWVFFVFSLFGLIRQIYELPKRGKKLDNRSLKDSFYEGVNVHIFKTGCGFRKLELKLRRSGLVFFAFSVIRISR